MTYSVGNIRQREFVGMAVGILLCLVLTGVAGATEHLEFANGIRATIHAPDEILGQVKVGPGGAVGALQTGGGTVELSVAPGDFHPFEWDYVVRALREMSCLTGGVDVSVYILPVPLQGIEGSMARRDAIYLAPGYGPVLESTVAYITTHEMGHVLTWAFMDDEPLRWERYMQLRGLDVVANGPAAIHAERAREILAEDVRFLFGGAPATESGSIENHHLALPNRVAGLKEMLSGFFLGPETGPVEANTSAFPNPCNPLTTIAMEIPQGATADAATTVLRVYDLRGALVTVHRGGRLANNRITMQWTGITGTGAAAASGRYIYVMQAGDLVARGSVTLVR